MGAAGTGEKVYVEDVFSTYLYTGNETTNTITNGIDISGEGALIWTKSRSGTANHRLIDTARTSGSDEYVLSTNLTNGQGSAYNLMSFSNNGYTIDANAHNTFNGFNDSGVTYASWTFRKAAKFFDVVTWTSTSPLQANRRISHNLGSAPGCIIIKVTNASDNWWVYHRSEGRSKYLALSNSNASQSQTNAWGTADPTSTDFGFDETVFASSGQTYVAYLFAHDAGGFGDSGSGSIIKCGTFTGAGAGNTTTIDLGWEPQWILVKRTDAAQNWYIFDNMRGLPNGSDTTAYLVPNTTAAEVTGQTSTGWLRLTATGFLYGPDNYMGDTAQIIYIAIRRGPMKTPTDATKVYNTITYTANGTADTIRTTSILTDLIFTKNKGEISAWACFDRMRGAAAQLRSDSSLSETIQTGTSIGLSSFARMDGYIAGADASTGAINMNTYTTNDYINYAFRRAPSFFDVVAYTGTGSAQTVSHNLAVVPELMIVKSRSAGNWNVYSSATGATKYLNFNGTIAATTSSTRWNDTSPTSSVFTAGTTTSASGENFIAYFFATCNGISKVGSYTGTGTTLQINCGFTNGARFVLIKRTDSTGNWYVWNTVSGIVSGNDPYLWINTSPAEDTSTDYIDPYSTGFEISSTAPAAINANGGSYIFLAIA